MSLTDLPEVDSPQSETTLAHNHPPKKRPILATVWAAIALAVVCIACVMPGSADAYLFRVMAGQVISEKGIPATDPFTWTAQSQPLYLDGWLACFLFYQINSHLSPLFLVI